MSNILKKALIYPAALILAFILNAAIIIYIIAITHLLGTIELTWTNVFYGAIALTAFNLLLYTIKKVF